MFRSRPLWLAALTLVAGALLVACDGDSKAPAKIKPADIPGIAAAVKDDAPSLNRIEQIIDLGSEAVPALVPLAGSQNEAERYTAIAALGRIGTSDGAKPADIEAATKALASRLDDPNVSLRTYAAGGLVAMGDKRGMPVLIEALSLQQRGYLSVPPELLNAFAYRALNVYTGQAFGYDPLADETKRATSQQQWRDWWKANSERLQWDAGKRVFGLK
ncbi:MAG: HEAT repeat domain-containing protein [Chloroflexi bacterium]|nr:MAG: HEAT repeat domain-containing protein [Chloroflexota bacterium]